MKDAVGDLTKSLNDYNSSVNNSVNNVNKAFQAIGVIMISVMMLIEMLSWYRYIKRENGDMTWRLFLEIAFKYAIAYALVMFSGKLVKVFLWFFDGVTTQIGLDVQENTFDYSPLKKGNWAARNSINVISFISGGFAILSIKIVSFLRFIELYLLKAVSPIIVAFWMADSTRSIATNFLKRAGAIAFQSVIIVILVLIWQGIKMDQVTSISSNGWLGNLASGISYIGKCGVFIFLLFGSQRMAKSLFQAN